MWHENVQNRKEVKMTYHTTERLLGLVPVAAASGIATRSIKGISGTSRKQRVVTKQNTRKFNGKVYQAANWHTTKARAEKDAEYFRKAGHSARVVKYYNPSRKEWGYMVYVR